MPPTMPEASISAPSEHVLSTISARLPWAPVLVLLACQK